jgi:hypothetical protein
MRSVHVMACSLLALVFSASVFAADGEESSPCNIVDRDSAPITGQELLGDSYAIYTGALKADEGAVFPESLSPRYVDAFLIEASNAGSDICQSQVTLRAQSLSDDKTLATVSAKANQTNRIYVLLPRPVLIEPGGTSSADGLNLILQNARFSSSADCVSLFTVYSRPATEIKTAVVPQVPLPSYVSLDGEWASTLGSTYDISQDNDTFTWDVKATGEKGTGTISVLQVKASWDGPLGSGSSEGKVTLNTTGKAVRIEWKNGVAFFRD